MSTNDILLISAILLAGCTIALLVELLFRPLGWARMRRRIDTLIKVRLQQQLQYHETRCPMVQVFTQPDGTTTPPEGKKATAKLILSFMMTHYPKFITELEEHAHTRLSATEQQICFLLKLGIRNKQIAESMGVSTNSVIKAKQRLRPKLTGAPEGEELTAWIQCMGEPLGKLPQGYVVFGTAEEETN